MNHGDEDLYDGICVQGKYNFVSKYSQKNISNFPMKTRPQPLYVVQTAPMDSPSKMLKMRF